MINRFEKSYLNLLPGVLLLILFLMTPLFSIITLSLGEREGISGLGRYQAVLKDSFILSVTITTIRISLITTLVSILMGFPTAYFISRSNQRWKPLFIGLTVFPLLINAVVRSLSWMIILGKEGLINQFLIKIKILSVPLNLLYSELAIVLGSIYIFLPLMVVALIGVMDNIPQEIEEAALSLGAERFTLIRKILLPLCFPGVLVGSILVFTATMTAYTTPQMLGGDNNMVLATLVRQQGLTLGNWSTASILAILMFLITLSFTLLLNHFPTHSRRYRNK